MTETSIIEENGHYKYQNKEGGKRKITNFTLNPSYEIQDDDGFKKYQVFIYFGTKKHGPYMFQSSDWKSQQNFREWLGKCSGQLYYSGGNIELVHLIRHAFQKSDMKQIKIIDGYGNVMKDLWIFDNAAIYKNDVIKADKSGLIWIDGLGVKGIRTTTSRHGTQFNVPDEYFSVEYIIEKLVEFYYEPMMIWPMIGYATATIYFKEISRKLGCFPPFLLWGPKQSGKTRYANIIKSMCGAGTLSAPSAESSIPGVRRFIARTHSFPAVMNDFQGHEREKMMCSFFDLDPFFMGKRTSDTQTTSMGFNSSGILTAIKTPEREDVISRLLMVDFHKFEKDMTLGSEFLQFFYDGVMEGKNFGFFYDMLCAEMEEDVVPTIQKVTKAFMMRLGNIDTRQQTILGIIAGAFLTACDALNLYDIFEKLEAEVPNEDNIVEVFKELAGLQTRLMSERKEMRNFFEILNGLFLRDKLEDFIKIDEDTDSRKFIAFNLSGVFPVVKREDNYTGNNLRGITQSYVSNQLKVDFGVTSKTGSINAKHMRLHSIYLHALKSKYGYDFETGEKDIREDMFTKKDEDGKVPF